MKPLFSNRTQTSLHGLSRSYEDDYNQCKEGDSTAATPQSPQVEELIELHLPYQAKYIKCLYDIASCRSVVALRKLYPTEWNSWKGMRDRVRHSHHPQSPELDDFRFFLAHVGPKHRCSPPKYSLDKVENDQGYVINNLRWATPKQQTENRRTSRFNVLGPRRVTDRQLARVLSEITGRTVSYETVKKRRLRGKSAQDQFAMEGASFPFGVDAVHAWEFPYDYRKQMERRYHLFHRSSEPRILFFIRTLEHEREKLGEILLRNRHNPDLEDCEDIRGKYGDDMSMAQSELFQLRNIALLATVAPLYEIDSELTAPMCKVAPSNKELSMFEQQL